MVRPRCLPEKDPTCLILSGGGSRIVATLGALCHIHELYPCFLDQVSKYVGTSAGAILSLLLCCGYTIPELQLMLNELDMASFISIDFGLFFQPSVLGIDDGYLYLKWIADRMKLKGVSPDISLLELQEKTGKSLVAITTDINTKSIFCMTPDTVPQFSALLAVRASIGIPILFKPIIYEDKCLVDGGVLCPFAFDLFVSLIADTETILGINLKEPDMERTTTADDRQRTPRNMYEMFCICLSLMTPSVSIDVDKEADRCTASFPHQQHTVLNIGLSKFYNIIAATKEQQDEMFTDGWSAVESS